MKIASPERGLQKLHEDIKKQRQMHSEPKEPPEYVDINEYEPQQNNPTKSQSQQPSSNGGTVINNNYSPTINSPLTQPFEKMNKKNMSRFAKVAILIGAVLIAWYIINPEGLISTAQSIGERINLLMGK